MKKPITVKTHLSLEALETRYRKAKDAVERSHWQIIWLLAEAQDDQRDCGEHQLLPSLDSHAGSSLQ
jgi:hypothetical protein